jgi:hypothetical protein
MAAGGLAGPERCRAHELFRVRAVHDQGDWHHVSDGPALQPAVDNVKPRTGLCRSAYRDTQAAGLGEVLQDLEQISGYRFVTPLTINDKPAPVVSKHTSSMPWGRSR